MGRKPRWLGHLGGVLFCGFAKELCLIIDQDERDFTGAHFENCPREDQESFGVFG